MRHLALLLPALLFSALTHATSAVNITTITCSGSQSFDLTNSAALSCSGDFSLIGGSIVSDQAVSINALGSLFIDDLTIRAPSIQLLTGSGELTLTDGVSIIRAISGQGTVASNTLPGITTVPPDLTVSPGANISLTGGVARQDPIIPQPAGEIRLIGSDFIIPSAPMPTLDPNRGTLTLVSSVPEPDKVWSMLAGAVLLLAIGRVRGSR